MPGLASHSSNYLMSVQIISKIPKSLAFGMHLLTRTQRAQRETDPGVLAFKFYYIL